MLDKQVSIAKTKVFNHCNSSEIRNNSDPKSKLRTFARFKKTIKISRERREYGVAMLKHQESVLMASCTLIAGKWNADFARKGITLPESRQPRQSSPGSWACRQKWEISSCVASNEGVMPKSTSWQTCRKFTHFYFFSPSSSCVKNTLKNGSGEKKPTTAN